MAEKTPLIAMPTCLNAQDAPAEKLVDVFGRHITYLRLSITDRCDFRCTYCMAEDMQFLPRNEVLSLEEALLIARVFASLGVKKLRLTGGEPLVRKNILWLIENLGRIPGLDNLVLTTNGSQLENLALPLKAAGVRRLNISLDTLRADRFLHITRIGSLEKVLRGIQAATEAGFKRTKINTVMMRGINDDEFIDLVDFACKHGLDITFIEEMPLGNIEGRSRTQLSSEETLQSLSRRFPLIPSDESTGGPAQYWRIPGTESRVGFISPNSHNFCDTCNRVRITAKGELYPCLGQNGAIELLPLLRSHPDDPEPLRQAIIQSMGMKPFGHDFASQIDRPQVMRFMSMTGG